MTPRPLKELYEILLNDTDYFGFGICSSISTLKDKCLISIDEYNILSSDFLNRKPSIFNKFFWHYTYTGYLGAYWWDISDVGVDQHIKCIKHIINKL